MAIPYRTTQPPPAPIYRALPPERLLFFGPATRARLPFGDTPERQAEVAAGNRFRTLITGSRTSAHVPEKTARGKRTAAATTALVARDAEEEACVRLGERNACLPFHMEAFSLFFFLQ